MSANTGARKAKLRRGGDAPADEAGARADADPAGLAGPDAAPRLPAGLHLVATPIGNAADITLRALDVLARADALAAEDTRSLRRLMEIHGVALRGRPLLAYHDRNGDAARPAILARLEVGESVALVSDAGTPLIADPGYKLARDAARAGLPVTTAPGSPRSASRACRPTGSCSPASRPPARPRAGPSWPSSRPYPRRWCSSKAPGGRRRRSPTWPRPWGPSARPPSAAS